MSKRLSEGLPTLPRPSSPTSSVADSTAGHGPCPSRAAADRIGAVVLTTSLRLGAASTADSLQRGIGRKLCAYLLMLTGRWQVLTAR